MLNYEIKKQSHDWCKKLLIDIVFCSICFRNIWKGTSIPPLIPLAEFGHIFVRLKSTPAGGHCVRTLNYVHNAPKPVGIVASYVIVHLVQRMWLSPLVGPDGIEPSQHRFSVCCSTCWATVPYTRHKWNICWSWTNDRLFNRQLLYQLS